MRALGRAAPAIVALVGEPLVAAPVEESDPNKTTCSYQDEASGVGFVYVSVHWAGGAQEWEFWAAAIGMADDIWQDTENVALDNVNVDAGPVPGLGDRAYYGGILPSLVLKDDTLMEFAFPLLPDPEKHFTTIVQSALSRL